MHRNEQYYLSVGELDRERLQILNSLYNVSAMRFMQENGLRPGMNILEIGCGIGEFACELAKVVGDSGKVIAIDQSSEQIKIAKETARLQKVNNIEFFNLKVENLSELDMQFDMAYSRWTFIFLTDPNVALQKVKNHLRLNGVLVIEDADGINHGIFGYPDSLEINEWCDFFQTMLMSNNLSLKFGDSLYDRFKQLKFNNIQLRTNHPLLTKSQDKKVFHLGLLTAKDFILKNNIMTEVALQDFISRMKDYEQSSGLVGFFRNIMISGTN